MASLKQRAHELAEKLGASTDASNYYDGDVWVVDFIAPKGKCWIGTGLHGTCQRELTLTECWKDAIEVMRDGLEDCDCQDCGIESAPSITHRINAVFNSAEFQKVLKEVM